MSNIKIVKIIVNEEGKGNPENNFCMNHNNYLET